MSRISKSRRESGETSVDRRGFMKIVGVTGAAAGALPLGAAAAEAQTAGNAQAPLAPSPAGQPDPQTWLFFNSNESAFIVAAADTLIPSDSVGPGAVEAGVPTYIDRQLAGAYGQGDRLYLEGPFGDHPTPQQGYQLPLTPAELIRTGIAEVNAYTLSSRGKFFETLSADDRAAVITELEKNTAKLPSVPAAAFVDLLLQLVTEGYFADPVYGGNKNKAVWRMLGFPGAGVVFTDKIVAYRNKQYKTEPTSIADLS
ncbi:MAG TPA: gluconate 2-dehydrogenase subunit 3 family protein [Beijerinckiaceae bacterium]|nr:gluconate 2-dehydrogenase subunit 3 family protein [Beijerinckiaceae bacterium]